MKKLTHYAIKVKTTNQLKQAIEFYRLASHRPLIESINETIARVSFNDTFVGLGSWSGCADSQRFVIAGNRTYPTETVIPFSQIKSLADSPSRMRAYNKVFSSK